jgi:hypothetical protein
VIIDPGAKVMTDVVISENINYGQGRKKSSAGDPLKDQRPSTSLVNTSSSDDGWFCVGHGYAHIWHNDKKRTNLIHQILGGETL